jgi:hypothetical protein
MKTRIFVVVAALMLVAALLVGPSHAHGHFFASHGICSFPETPGKLVSDVIRGWGRTFTGKENTFHWIHLPVTVETRVWNYGLHIGSIDLLFQTLNNCTIQSVHVYEGAVLRHSWNNLNWTGDFRNTAKTLNWTKPHLDIIYGMNIRLGVQFGAKVGEEYGKLLLCSGKVNMYSHEPNP